jgi:deferrochelatase/peroxidase EfeB
VGSARLRANLGDDLRAGDSCNLQGFKDGTNNVLGDDSDAMTRLVWVGNEEPQAWFRGGS